jgi:homoserine acetyltransferase
MDDEMITIRMPKKLCRIFHHLAELAAESDISDAARPISHMLKVASKKGVLQFDNNSLLDIYKLYDEYRLKAEATEEWVKWETRDQVEEALKRLLEEEQ